MRITIDTNVLHKYNMGWVQFLERLKGFLGVSLETYRNDALVLSDQSKELVARILTESNPSLKKSPIKDFEGLASKLQDIYPKGNKEGTTYPWRGTVEEIAQKLRVLVAEHDFIYTEEEAINATKQYVDSFKDDRTHMKLLKYFLLRTKDGEISSDFMTIIENNRNENNNR